MPSVRNYFTTDPLLTGWAGLQIAINHSRPASVARGGDMHAFELEITHKLDYEANALCIYFYIPPAPTDVIAPTCRMLVDQHASNAAALLPPAFASEGISIARNTADRPLSSLQLVYTRELVFYVEGSVPDVTKQAIYTYGDQRVVVVRIRDMEYARLEDEHAHPLAFICHDWRDKSTVAEPLVKELVKRVGRIWYDEYSLRVGDSLRESIERGLKECRKCVLVLTPNFLSNQGWPATEFTSIFTREHMENSKLILPVWDGVSPEDVFAYSPSLADRFAAHWEKGAETVAQQIAAAILGERPAQTDQ